MGSLQNTQVLTGGPDPSLANSIGMFLLGGLIACLLFGINCVQVFVFYRRTEFEHIESLKRRDSKKIQATVILLWVLNATHIGLTVDTLWYYFIKNFDNRQVLVFSYWGVATQTIVTILSNTIVRCYFAYRVWIVSRERRGRWLIALTLAALIIGNLFMGLLFGAQSYSHNNLTTLHSIAWSLYVSLALSIATDLLTTTMLCYHLYASRTGIRRMDSVLNVLMLYSIDGGIITTLCNIGTLVTFAAKSDTFIFMAIFFVSSKLYFMSFLATLNCRDVLRAQASQPVTLLLPATTTLTAVGSGGLMMPGMYRCEGSLTTTPRLGSPRSSPRLRRLYTMEGGSPKLLEERTVLRRMGSSRSVVRLQECAFIGKGDDTLKIPLPELPNDEQMQQQAVHELHLHGHDRNGGYDLSYHPDLERGLFPPMDRGGAAGDLRDRVWVDSMQSNPHHHHLSIIELPVGDALSGRPEFQSRGSDSSEGSTKYEEGDL